MTTDGMAERDKVLAALGGRTDELRRRGVRRLRLTAVERNLERISEASRHLPDEIKQAHRRRISADGNRPGALPHRSITLRRSP